tara:strand:+ start:12080 stop:13564 length:1485 start_codon:yes stop_codon:yes gene_type:complete
MKTDLKIQKVNDMQCPHFDNLHVIVVGDAMLDRYWHGDTSRISPEAPVPVIKVDQTEERVGGAANVAVNVSALAARTTLISAIGQDAFGERLQFLLEKEQVSCDFIRSAEVDTITKLRVLGRHQQLLRLDFEKYYPWPADIILEKLEPHWASADALILSDYAKGMLANPQAIIQAARQHNVRVIVDPKDEDLSLYRGASILTPNLKEFEAAVGKCLDEQAIVEKGQRLLKDLSLDALLVTRSADGMTLLQSNEKVLHIPTQAREVYDITGAGDTVIAVLASVLAYNGDYALGAQLANVAAGISVGRLGTATVSRAELENNMTTPNIHADFLSEAKLLSELQKQQKNNKKIVMTNGCFDILHPGHLHYLEEAKSLGDCLVVAINDDASIKRLKGETRPINPLKDRVKALLALKSVDYVVSFSTDTPRDLIANLLPDILVKGGDYEVSQIAGAKEVIANGGSVEILSFIDGYSTSDFIQRILNTEGHVEETAGEFV